MKMKKNGDGKSLLEMDIREVIAIVVLLVFGSGSTGAVVFSKDGDAKLKKIEGDIEKLQKKTERFKLNQGRRNDRMAESLDRLEQQLSQIILENKLKNMKKK